MSERKSLFAALDLFAGPGGWDEGIGPLGIRPLGIELDAAACDTREAAGHRTMREDVSTLEPGWFKPCELLIGSPPCQAFSAAGKGEGKNDIPIIYKVARDLGRGSDSRNQWRQHVRDDRSLFVVEPLRFALGLRPRWIALEQVPPVLTIWQAFADILREHGYKVWCGILSAERFGIPQTRERAFLLADSESQPMPPVPTHQAYEYGVPASEQHTMEGTLLPWVSMAEALGWGMSARPSVTVTAQANHSGGAAPLDGGSGARETLRRERREGRWFDRRQGNTLPNGERQMVRLVPDSEPAPTISAGTGDRDRWVFDRPATTIAGDRRVFQPGGHHEPVPITIEEASVLQGFRSDYPWQGDTNKQRFQQVGNAVPPPLAAAVITSLLGSELALRAEAVAA